MTVCWMVVPKPDAGRDLICPTIRFTGTGETVTLVEGSTLDIMKNILCDNVEKPSKDV